MTVSSLALPFAAVARRVGMIAAEDDCLAGGWL